jgi:hypothetical protein
MKSKMKMKMKIGEKRETYDEVANVELLEGGPRLVRVAHSLELASAVHA